MIVATLVNAQTHRGQLLSGYTTSSASQLTMADHIAILTDIIGYCNDLMSSDRYISYWKSSYIAFGARSISFWIMSNFLQKSNWLLSAKNDNGKLFVPEPGTDWRTDGRLWCGPLYRGSPNNSVAAKSFIVFQSTAYIAWRRRTAAYLQLIIADVCVCVCVCVCRRHKPRSSSRLGQTQRYRRVLVQAAVSLSHLSLFSSLHASQLKH